MAKKWIGINLLLLVIAGLLGWELRAAILQFIAENDPARIRPSRVVRPAAVSSAASASKPTVKVELPDDLSIISAKTIFSEARGTEELVETTRPPEPPPLTQKPILVGIIMQDNQYKAFIIDPAATGDKRRAEARQVGDVFRGYTITAISGDRIVLENGTRREIIPLHEGSKKSQSGKTAVSPPRVVAFGGSAVTGGAIAVVSTKSAPAPRAAAPAPVNLPSGGAQLPQTMPGGVSGRIPVQRNPVVAPQPSTPQSPNPGTGSGTRIIRSPFGDMVRPDQN